MTHGRRSALVLVAATAATTSARRAQVPEVEVTPVPEHAAVHPGTSFRVAVRLRVPPGWHIGWINPGSGGLATTIAWHAPAGVSVGETEWPYPETDDAGGKVSNVYRGTVVLFSAFRPDAGVRRSVTITADVDWGLCREECVRQHHTLSVSIPVAPGGSERSRAWTEVELAQRALPIRLPARAARVDVVGDSVRVILTQLPAGPAAGSWLTFFPLEAGKTSVVARSGGEVEGVAITLPRTVLSGAPAERLSGVLVPAHPPGAAPAARPLLVDAPVAR